MMVREVFDRVHLGSGSHSQAEPDCQCELAADWSLSLNTDMRLADWLGTDCQRVSSAHEQTWKINTQTENKVSWS